MQEFIFPKKLVNLIKRCLVVLIGFLAFGLALPFLSAEEKGNPNGVFVVTILCTVVFGFSIVFTLLTLKKLPYVDVVIDEDGIWYKHLGKDQGLVTWDKISKVKERACMQCLELLGSNGDKLMRVEYQLNGFEILRNVLDGKISNSGSDSRRHSFSKGFIYHLFHLAAFFGISALGLYVGATGHARLGYGATNVFVIFCVHEYLTTVTGANLTNNSLEVIYPYTRKNIPFSEIKNIHIVDMFHQGMRIPEVWIISKTAKKPFRLRQLGVDSNVLYRIVKKAVQL